jgi:hypothetical protein
MKKTGIVENGEAAAVIKERSDRTAVLGSTSAADTIPLRHRIAITWKADLSLRKTIIVGATLMSTEMTTVKGMNQDMAMETMKADIRTIVASPLAEVEEVVIKENTELHIIAHMGRVTEGKEPGV